MIQGTIGEWSGKSVILRAVIMKLSIRAKLIFSFFIVIIITGIIAVAAGFQLIGTGIVREAQTKVDMDLNMARELYRQKLRSVQEVVQLTTLRQLSVVDAIRKNDCETLLNALNTTRETSGLDILSATDLKGNVLVRSRNPNLSGDSQAQDKIIKRVLASKQAWASTAIISAEELAKESAALAEQANIKIISTPKSVPRTQAEETSGMLLKAASPVLDDNGILLGVIYGGILLNRNFEIVDKVKDTAYQGMTYKGRDIGTATIFQNDLRVSTNVKNKDGARAIGTCVSAEVYDKVLKKGLPWQDRAFVVNDWYYSAYEPIRDIDEKIIGILYVGLLAEKYADMRSRIILTLLGITGIGLLLALWLAFLLANPISKRIRHLKQGTEAIAGGNFDYEVHARGSDELADLSDSFNRVRLRLKDYYEKLHGKINLADENLKKANKELLEKQALLVQSEKLASLGRLAAGIAHEINNPLTGVLTSAQIALESTNDASLKEELQIIISETIRCRNIVRRLLEFSRQKVPEKNPANVNNLLLETLAIMKNQIGLHRIQVNTDLAQDLPDLNMDIAQIKEVFMNIIINAIDAMGEDGVLKITSQKAPNDFVAIRFADSGKGILPENLNKIFDPFFTTKDATKGTGLGLSVSLGIIEQHLGKIEAESVLGKGTTLTIRLPIATEK